MLNIDDYKLLENANTKINKFSLKGHKTYAKCVYVYDGDTVHVVFKIPNGNECYKWVVRLNGIDTPEMKSKNINEKKAALLSRDFLKNQILDKIIIIDCLDFDKYGRLLGELFIEGNDVSLSKQMIENGHAKAYDGGTKEGWAELDSNENNNEDK